MTEPITGALLSPVIAAGAMVLCGTSVVLNGQRRGTVLPLARHAPGGRPDASIGDTFAGDLP